MHSYGGPALNEFGYEPLRSFSSSNENNIKGSIEAESYINFKTV